MRELAHIYEDQQKNDEAIAIYNKLLDKDPYSHADWFDLARLLALRGKYDEAIEACDFALAIDEKQRRNDDFEKAVACMIKEIFRRRCTSSMR